MKTIHEQGYTECELKNIMTAKQWDDFGHWMVGQTMSACPNCGATIYYTDDVERFLKNLPVID
jgi:hypothetical protein